MKKVIFIIVFVFLVNLVYAQEEDFNKYTGITVNFNIDGNFTLVQSGTDPIVDDVSAILTFFPQNDAIQNINSKWYYSTPVADVIENLNRTEFKWISGGLGNYNFGVNAEATIRNAIITIDEKISFPIDNTNNQEYIEPTEFIDITPEIKQLAQSLAEGEDDLYVVSMKMAEWVESNIEYDLSTLTAEAVQKSSWVLDNKQGVCDELTNLFISMMRSVGVPARFVSGVAYTNLGYKWGPHGWAEVYFPGKGWVPFDITYKQFGWIDPGHVKLKVNEDSGDATARYSWRAHNVQMEKNKLNISATLKNKKEKITPMPFEITPLLNNVGPGSYVPVEIKIRNGRYYYFPRSFVVTKSPELTENNFKIILLKPLETKSLFWIVKIPKEIESNSIYKTFIEVEDQFHTNKSTEITFSEDLQIITLEEAQAIVRAAQQTEEKVLSRELNVECNAPNYAFSYEVIKIDCKLRNIGNTNLETSLCYENTNCKTVTLGIAEEKEVSYDLNLLPGVQNLKFVSKLGSSEASDLVTINVLENPDLKFVNLDYPEIINYKDDFNISMILSVKAPVTDVKIRINGRSVVVVPEIELSKSAVIITKGSDFVGRENIEFVLQFKDLNNREYEIKSSYPIHVANIPWYIKILMFLKII